MARCLSQNGLPENALAPRLAPMRSPRLVLSSLLSLSFVVACSGSCGSTQSPAARTSLVTAGEAAPAFSAQDQDGRTRTLAEFQGRAVVLYFYPRDATPGCTREACAFRDAWDRLSATGAQVIGVSTDDVASHRSFATEHRLQFPLLADVDATIVQAYGVGTRMGMAERVTVLIGRDGRVSHVFPNVDPAVHVNEVLQALGSASAR